ncbi:MAG: response regulator transcription factor [Proteobacteria bacterium]|nr:response regulator transcription factor [Pseudomonadota bacterium]
MRVLLVEDDPILGGGIKSGLALSGMTVDWVQTCAQGQEASLSNVFDVVVLDIGLPDKSGLELLDDIRKKGQTLPVLVLTAKDTLADKVKGFNLGADDYLIKPFALDELVLRLRAIHRRATGRCESRLVSGSLVVDPQSFRVELDGATVELPHREFGVLVQLLENQGRVLTRGQLEQSLYGWNEEVESNAVEVHIHHLRKKLGNDLIKTIRGVGYLIQKK